MSVRVPVFTVSQGQGVAVTLEVSVGRGRDCLWGATPAVRFRQDAYRAIERAWSAAAILAPPHALEAHEITVRPFAGSWLDANVTLEGGSLAVPMAVGFAALWAGRPWPEDFYATGDLVRSGAAWVVGPVGGVPRKLDRVPHGSLLHVPKGQAAGLRTRELVDLASVWGASGVPPHPGAAGLPEPLHARVAALILRTRRAAGVCVPAGRTLDGVSPWYQLGAELREASAALRAASRGRDDRDLAIEGQLWSAIACAYAGAYDAISADALAGAREALARQAYPRASELLRLLDVLDLSRMINAADWSRGEALAERVEAAGTDDDVGGRALGTAGRFWLHRHPGRDLGRARALLERSVEVFDTVNRDEVPRSRIYLAQAWLMGALGGEAGALERAAQELDQAEVLLTPRDQSSYRVTTGMFLDYTRARVALAAGRPGEAATLAAAARRLSFVWGPSFQVGVLRVLALATGDPRYHAEALELAGDSTQPALHRKLREAAGEVLDPPEAS